MSALTWFQEKALAQYESEIQTLLKVAREDLPRAEFNAMLTRLRLSAAAEPKKEHGNAGIPD